LTNSSWTHSRDLEHLSPKAIKDFLNEPRGRATGDLKRGYQVAQDPTEWDAEQKDVRQAKEDALNQVDELEDEDEDVAAGKRKKSGKDKSKKKAKTAQVSVVAFRRDMAVLAGRSREENRRELRGSEIEGSPGQS
jgi:D-tyrosyl-tRNA(Tyr) deacylase